MGLVHDYLNILKEKGLYKLGIPRVYFSKTMRRAGPATRTASDPPVFSKTAER